MMRLRPVVASVFLTATVAYYVYAPLPESIQEPWRLMLVSAVLRTSVHLTSVINWLGYDHYIRSVRQLSESVYGLAKSGGDRGGESCGGGGGVVPGVKVSDVAFAGVPVQVYEPPAGGEGHLRRGLMHFHGGEWLLGSAERWSNNALNHMVSDELNTVVVSVEYRLYPEVRFPVPYLDCLAAAKHFLSPEVLSKYSIDPERVAVSGSSVGGNLAAAVAQAIATDDTVSVKFSIQALIYPMLQALDFNTPSYLQNQDIPVLYRGLAARFWLQYLGADLSLQPQLLANNHSQSAVSSELRAHVDWTALLPAKFKKNRRAVAAQQGSQRLVKEVPALLDARASPLLAGAETLAKCPRAYVVTCEHDVLRDDGLMYARRLQDAGVAVAGRHYDDGFHGCFSFTVWPLEFDVGKRSVRGYISWLQNNL